MALNFYQQYRLMIPETVEREISYLSNWKNPRVLDFKSVIPVTPLASRPTSIKLDNTIFWPVEANDQYGAAEDYLLPVDPLWEKGHWTAQHPVTSSLEPLERKSDGFGYIGSPLLIKTVTGSKAVDPLSISVQTAAYFSLEDKHVSSFVNHGSDKNILYINVSAIPQYLEKDISITDSNGNIQESKLLNRYLLVCMKSALKDIVGIATSITNVDSGLTPDVIAPLHTYGLGATADASSPNLFWGSTPATNATAMYPLEHIGYARGKITDVTKTVVNSKDNWELTVEVDDSNIACDSGWPKNNMAYTSNIAQKSATRTKQYMPSSSKVLYDGFVFEDHALQYSAGFNYIGRFNYNHDFNMSSIPGDPNASVNDVQIADLTLSQFLSTGHLSWIPNMFMEHTSFGPVSSNLSDTIFPRRHIRTFGRTPKYLVPTDNNIINSVLITAGIGLNVEGRYTYSNNKGMIIKASKHADQTIVSRTRSIDGITYNYRDVSGDVHIAKSESIFGFATSLFPPSTVNYSFRNSYAISTIVPVQQTIISQYMVKLGDTIDTYKFNFRNNKEPIRIESAFTLPYQILNPNSTTLSFRCSYNLEKSSLINDNTFQFVSKYVLSKILNTETTFITPYLSHRSGSGTYLFNCKYEDKGINVNQSKKYHIEYYEDGSAEVFFDALEMGIYSEYDIQTDTNILSLDISFMIDIGSVYQCYLSRYDMKSLKRIDNQKMFGYIDDSFSNSIQLRFYNDNGDRYSSLYFKKIPVSPISIKPFIGRI